MKNIVCVPLRTTPEERQRLDYMAAEAGMSRSELLRRIVHGTRVQIITTLVLQGEMSKGTEAERGLTTDVTE